MKCRPEPQLCDRQDAACHEERRQYPRRPCSEPIQLFGEDPLPFGLDATLLDMSEGGFRVMHHYSSLERGQEVAFEYAGRKGRARAVWNRILPDRIETGFTIIP